MNNLMRYKADFKEGGADEFVQMANSHVPFLNGGLFDCLDKKPEKLYYDGFSEGKSRWNSCIFPTGFSLVTRLDVASTFLSGMVTRTRRVYLREALLTS